jgi:hypothetical protein
VSVDGRECRPLHPRIVFRTESSKTGEYSTTFLRENSAVLPLLTKNLLQGLTELYRSYPPQPDIPRPDHLLPSAAAEAKRGRAAEALPGSETTESGSPLAEREAEGEARRDNVAEPT